MRLVGESMTNPGKYFGNNVGNGVKLLEAAVAAGVRKFVFSSTCATYGPPERVPITEDLPQRPINPYGESKLMFEKILSWYQQIHELEFVAFRYFNAAGATTRFGEHHRIETHLIPRLVSVLMGQAEQAEIYGTDYPTPDGTCIRDYIHIVDLAQAHIQALTPGKQGFFNLGNGDGYSVRQVIEMCEQVSGRKIPVVEKSRRAGDPPKLVANADKARSRIGLETAIPQTGSHRPERLAVAPETPQWLSGLTWSRILNKSPLAVSLLIAPKDGVGLSKITLPGGLASVGDLADLFEPQLNCGTVVCRIKIANTGKRFCEMFPFRRHEGRLISIPVARWARCCWRPAGKSEHTGRVRTSTPSFVTPPSVRSAGRMPAARWIRHCIHRRSPDKLADTIAL